MFQLVTLGVIVLIAVVCNLASPNKCKVSEMKITGSTKCKRESEKQTYGNKQGGRYYP